MAFLTEPEPARGVRLPVLPGIGRVVAPNPSAMTYWGTNTYLLDAEGGVVVVDPGPDDAGHVDALLRAAAGPVVGIVLTHTHHDHLGATAALRAATGAAVHGWHRPAVAGFAPDVALQDGDTVFGWESVHTPGHASDHLCFARDGVLLSGDHVMGWSSSVVPPPDGSMADYFRSLKRVMARPEAVFLPGHGPMLEKPAPFMRALLAHREMREAAILRALGPVPVTSLALTDRLYRGIEAALRRPAEANVVAHLGKLVAEGRAAAGPEGFSAAG